MTEFGIVRGQLVVDLDTEQYYIATDISGDTRLPRPRHWHVVPIEPLEDLMLRMGVEVLGDE